MANQLALFDEKVFESNAIARAQWSTSNVWIQRIAAILITQINPDDTKFVPMEIPLHEIIGSKGGKSYKLVRNIMNDLLTHRIIITRAEAHKTIGLNIFGGSVVYDEKENSLTVGLNQALAPFYCELKQRFVAYGLAEFLSLPGTYHQSLYKFLKSWESEPEHTEELFRLHHLLAAPESLRKNYGLFNAKALLPAHRFINEKTSLQYDYEPNKKGRKVVSVTFIFKSKAKFRKTPPRRSAAQEGGERNADKADRPKRA